MAPRRALSQERRLHRRYAPQRSLWESAFSVPQTAADSGNPCFQLQVEAETSQKKISKFSEKSLLEP